MKEYLPIGSVVTLKNGEKKIMIYGRRQLANDGSGEYDYIACLYPEGNIGEDYNFLFNNADIDNVVFKGFVDEEENEFQKILQGVNVEGNREPSKNTPRWKFWRKSKR